MKKEASELFSLIVELSYQNKTDRVIQLFVETINSVFSGYTFRWHINEDQIAENWLPVVIKTQKLGYIEYSKELAGRKELYILFYNACQMLTVILNCLEQEVLLNNQKTHLRHLIEDQTQHLLQKQDELNDINEEFTVLNEELKQSNLSLTELNDKLLSEIKRRIKLEESFTKNEVRYIRAESIGKVGNWEYDLKTNSFWGSDGAKRIYGLDSDKWKFTTDEVENCIPERERVHQALIDLIRSGKEYSLEFDILPKNSSEPKTIISIAELERDAEGNPLKISGVVQDVTERKKAQKALQQSEALFRSFVENANDIVFSLTFDGNFEYVSPNWAEFLGHDPDEVIGKNFTIFVHPDDLPVCMAAFEKAAIIGEKQSGIEYRTLHKDGSWKWHVTNTSSIKNSKGEIVSMIGIARDVTERKKAEEELHHLNRYLKAISNCNQYVIRAKEEKKLLKKICQIICEEAGYRFVWVGYAENNEEKTVNPVAWAGHEDGYLSSTKISWSDSSPYGQGLTGRVIREGKIYCIQDYESDQSFSPWHNDALKRGYRSSISLPLRDDDATVFGTLNIYSSKPDSFSEDEIRLLEELAGNLAFGISALRIRKKRERVEKKLVESQSLYQSFAEYLPASAFRKDKEGRYVFVNSQFCKLRGLKPVEIIGKTADELVEYEKELERESGRLAANYQHYLDMQGGLHHLQMMNTGLPVMLIEEHPLSNGTIKYYQVIKTPVFDADGNTIGSQGVQFDITERKVAEEKIRESEQLFSNIFYNSPVAISITSENGKIVDANNVFLNDLGFTREEAIGKSIVDLGVFYDSDYRDQLISKLFKEGFVNMFECPFRAKSGKILYGLLSMSRIVYKGSPHHFTTIIDITDRKKAEIKIQESEKLLNESQKISNIGSYIFDFSKKIWYGSTVLNEMLGVSPDDDHSVEKWFSVIHPDDKNELLNYFYNKVIKEKRRFDNEFRVIIKKNQQIKWVRCIGELEFDDNGSPLKMTGTAQDLTEKKYITSELIAAKEKAEESDRLKSYFLANMSHEIRTPMNSIMGFSSLLPDEKDPDLIAQYSKIIASNSEQLMHIIDDIVLYSRLQTRLLSFQSSEFDVRKLCNDIFQSFNLPEYHRGVELIIDSECEELIIHSDYEKLRQIIVNLLSNAFKYTSKGKITIGVKKTGDQLLFKISDTGVGIPPDELDKVFERFYRGVNIDRGKIGGTGLGLSIVHELVGLLQGKIWVESEQGKGSTFFFTIPNA